jgi:hypothetical protein
VKYGFALVNGHHDRVADLDLLEDLGLVHW